MNSLAIVGILLKCFLKWMMKSASFEYGLPVSPSSMANYIVRQIEIAGFEIVKVGTNE